MQEDPTRSGVDRTAFRLSGWDEHVATHDERARTYWLEQPLAVRLAGALQCRWRIDGPLPSIDRNRLRLINLCDIDG